MKLKLFLCLTVCLMLLFAPFLLDLSQNGKAYAFSSKSGNHSSSTGESATFGYTLPSTEDPGTSNGGSVRVPEPATWLLVGAGAAFMAAFRKKFSKK